MSEGDYKSPIILKCRKCSSEHIIFRNVMRTNIWFCDKCASINELIEQQKAIYE